MSYRQQGVYSPNFPHFYIFLNIPKDLLNAQRSFFFDILRKFIIIYFVLFGFYQMFWGFKKIELVSTPTS